MFHTVHLTRNKMATIDDVDADLLQKRWYCTKDGYACRDERPQNGKRKTIYMHRLILERKLGRPLGSLEISDHKNRNTLDNRRKNLRAASLSQSVHNTRPKRAASPYKGVAFSKAKGLWTARIMFRWKSKHIGYFSTVEEAARAYDYWAIQLHGEFAYLNFPQSQKQTIEWWGRYLPSAHKGSSTGQRGVYKNGNKWAARITRGNRRIFLGNFNTIEEASSAYSEAYKLLKK